MPSLPNITLRSQPAYFESERPIDECVDRLSARIDAFSPSDPARQYERRVSGVIDGDRVRLRVATPYTHNPFARSFHGRFGRRDGKTVLSGRFSVDAWLRACIAAWLFLAGFAGIVFLADLAIGTQKLSTRVGMVVFYVVVVLLYGFVMNSLNRIADADAELIRQEIEAALIRGNGCE